MKAKDERKELEKMLETSSANIGNEPQDALELQSEPMFDLDYDKLQKDCQRKAKHMISNATGLMLTDEVVKNNPYLKSKMQVDVISLSGMLYQLSINETAQKALLEEIRSGAMHPRMFEVFGQLSKTVGELNKQLLQTVEAIKMTYRDLRDDIRERNNDQLQLGEGITKNSKGLLTIGTKELIKETKRLKMEELRIQDIEDIETIE